MVNVIKRNGQVEPFDIDKLSGSIKKAMIDAKLAVEELRDEVDQMVDRIAEKISKSDEIDVSEIRKAVLDELEKNKSAAAVSWREFDGKYKSTQ